MANPIRYFPCPACGSALSMNSSRMITATVREQYAQCANEHCGAGFLIRSEVANQLSPPADLFAKKTSTVPTFADTDKQALDLAIEFLGRSWKSQKSTNDRHIECRNYLQEHLPISTDRADLFVSLALADWDSVGLERWGIDEMIKSGRTAVVVNEDMTKQHVISLRELTELIQEKQKQKQLLL